MIHYDHAGVTIHQGDAVEVLRSLPGESVNCCVTSPPYWGLRDYGEDGQIGLEATPEEYVTRLVEVFREVRRVLRQDGTLWLNLGDSYSAHAGQRKETDRAGIKQQSNTPSVNAPSRHAPGLKPKDLVGIPWRVAFALQADGWWLRQDIIWHKPNPMPESVTDRCTKAHEYIFLLSKNERYYFDSLAIAEPASRPDGAGNITHKGQTAYRAGDEKQRTKEGLTAIGPRATRNKRSVWTVKTQPFPEAHFATFPEALIGPCVLAGCPPSGKGCDCQEIIETPTGSGVSEDPSLQVGRAGWDRTRKTNEGARIITRYEQRQFAQQLRESPHRQEMERSCGISAFAHYIRTDRTGARPLPHKALLQFSEFGWLTPVKAVCECPIVPAGTVLDPFAGSGTTALVAKENGRRFIGVEINAAYCDIAARRVIQDVIELSEATA